MLALDCIGFITREGFFVFNPVTLCYWRARLLGVAHSSTFFVAAYWGLDDTIAMFWEDCLWIAA